MAIRADQTSDGAARSRLWLLARAWPFAAIAIVSLMLGLFGTSGCSGDTTPGPPGDPSANADLRLFVEVDYVLGMLGDTEDTIHDWEASTLQGAQSGDCTFLFSEFDDDIDVQITLGDELDWGGRPLEEVAGIANYQDEDGLTQAVAAVLQKSTQIEKRPNLHLTVIEHLVDTTGTSLDPDRFGNTWRFDDDTRASPLPEGVGIFGFTIILPKGPFDCVGGSYSSVSPECFVAVGTIKKMVREINDVLRRSTTGTPPGCGFSGDQLLSESKIVRWFIGHELMHQLAVAYPHSEGPTVDCHDGLCQCNMVAVFAGGRILSYSDNRVWWRAPTYNCAAAEALIAHYQSLCVGEVGHAYHWDERCGYETLRDLNPD